MSTVRIRPATKEDVPTVAGMAGELYAMHHAWDAVRFWDLGGHDPARRAGRERFFRSQVEAEDTFLLVAELDGAVVGYAYLTVEGPLYEDLLESSVWLHDIFVKPDARGTGAADALFEEGRRRAAATGHPLLAFTVAEPNTHAQKFFTKHGARLTMREMVVELKADDREP